MTNEQAKKFANCLKNNYTIDFNDMADFCDTVIKALEQQPSDDCVSRKAVDLLCFKYLKPNNDDNVAFYEHFCDLPPVTPTFPSSEDCVSRQAVLAIAGDSCLDLDNYEDTKEFCDAINELPSVTPTRCIAEIKFSKDDLREICNERIEVECTHGTCKDCKHWKDSDGVYRRGGRC